MKFTIWLNISFFPAIFLVVLGFFPTTTKQKQQGKEENGTIFNVYFLYFWKKYIKNKYNFFFLVIFMLQLNLGIFLCCNL